MSKNKTYIAVLPFWPLKLADSQNYFKQPLQLAQSIGYQTKKIINPKPQQLTSYLKSNHILHFHSTYRHVLLALIYCLFNNSQAKIIWTPHLAFNLKNHTTIPFNLIKILKPILQKLDHIITISPFETQYLNSLGFKHLSHLLLVINTSKLPKSEPSHHLKLVFFGGDRPVKNLVPVLKAFHILKQLNLRPKLSILDPVSNQFIHRYRYLFTQDIKLHHRLPHLSTSFISVLKNSHYFINNSLSEGTPLAAYESAYSGLSLCLSDLPSLKTIFKSTALYHHPHHPDQLVKNILFYYYNPKIKLKHTQINHKIAVKLTLPHFQKQFKSLLNNL